MPIVNLVAVFTKIDLCSDEERGLCRVNVSRVSIARFSNKTNPSMRGPGYMLNIYVDHIHV